jgi:hypothetical protein
MGATMRLFRSWIGPIFKECGGVLSSDPSRATADAKAERLFYMQRKSRPRKIYFSVVRARQRT